MSGAVIHHAEGTYLTERQHYPWTRDVAMAHRFATAEDAQAVAGGLVRRKAVLGGVPVYRLTSDVLARATAEVTARNPRAKTDDLRVLILGRAYDLAAVADGTVLPMIGVRLAS